MDSEQNSDPTPGTLAHKTNKKDKNKRAAPEEPEPEAEGAKKKEKRKRRDPHTIACVKKYFNDDTCFDISQLYRRAIYDNCAAGPEAQSVAVKSVLWHNLDRLDATVDQRKEYHKYCSSTWCHYQQYVAHSPPEGYKRLHDRNKAGKEVPWTGGYYAGLDQEYPGAFKDVQDIFDYIGHIDLMKRCAKKVTQNLNESLHSKLWRRVLKYKHHGKKRYKLACFMTVLVHNFGHEKGSLLHCLECMTKPTERDLRQKDRDSIRNAKRQHIVTDGGRRSRNRKKVKYGVVRNVRNTVNDNGVRNVRNTVNDNVGYEAGSEPINE